MSTAPELIANNSLAGLATHPVAAAVLDGLRSQPKWLPAWLFYDAAGSQLFEAITVLPEYYLTRTERDIFHANAQDIIAAAVQACRQTAGTEIAGNPLRVMELGAGTATKTGILLKAAVQRQGATDYLPLDVSETAIAEACSSMERTLPLVTMHPQIANYVTDAIELPQHHGPTLALYIGSSIGNFSPEEAEAILANLRAQLRPGDTLLLGTDLVKEHSTLLAAYNDIQGTTAAFNLNILRRLNAELGAQFHLDLFRHEALWNAAKSRIEMHLRSVREQVVRIPSLGMAVHFNAGETIHTENSHKFTRASVAALLQRSGFRTVTTWTDEKDWFAVTLAAAE